MMTTPNQPRKDPIDIQNDTKFEDAMQQVLTFYGVQLQSHAATMVSLAIGIFAVLSIRPSRLPAIIGFSILSSVLLVGMGYAFLRLFIYGQLSKSILYGTFSDRRRFQNEFDPKYFKWEDLTSYTKVSYYANKYFMEKSLPKRYFGIIRGKWLFTNTAQPRREVLVTIGLLSFLASLFFLFSL